VLVAGSGDRGEQPRAAEKNGTGGLGKPIAVTESA
jgi:hypothetical protein